MSRQQMKWTADLEEALKAMWSQGQSARLIAENLGQGISRSAVLCKVHRLNLDGRATTASAQGERRYAPRTRRPRIPPISADTLLEYRKTETSELTPDQRSRTVTFKQLGPRNCKWPYGTPGAADFCFCGGQREADSPYCAPHAALATQNKRSDFGTFKPIGEAAAAVVDKLKGVA